MKQTTNLLLILSLLVFPAFAHDRDPLPISLITTGGNDNHNNDSDNLKHVTETILLTGIVYCLISKCLSSNEEKTVIHFKTKQEPPIVP